MFFKLSGINVLFIFIFWTDENVIGLSLQEILPDNNIVKSEKMLVANPPNILKRAKSLKNQDLVCTHLFNAITKIK